jgi:hypothetical protein
MAVCHRNSLVDLIHAAYRLETDDPVELTRIARMLGFDVALDRSIDRPPTRKRQAPWIPAPKEFGDDDHSSLKVERPSFDPLDDAWIELQPNVRPDIPQIRADIKPFPIEDEKVGSHKTRVPPLFQPKWIRAILEAALATRSLCGDVDIDAIVEILSHSEVLSSLPRLPVTDLRRGVQLLCDTGDSMKPFIQDVWSMVESIERLLIPELFQVLVFNGTPLGGVGNTYPPNTYQPPRPGTPVLVLSDLGAGWRPQSTLFGPTEDWLRFARILRRKGCPLLVFCPYGVSRVPRVLRQAMLVIPWDRQTTTAQIIRIKHSMPGADSK